MKLTATLCTGHLVASKEYYLFVYRRRIYDDGTEIIDSIEGVRPPEYALGPYTYNYKSDDIVENMNRDTEIIIEDVWQEYCDKLTKYLTENNIINSKT